MAGGLQGPWNFWLIFISKKNWCFHRPHGWCVCSRRFVAHRRGMGDFFWIGSMKVDSFFTAFLFFFREGNDGMKTQGKCTNHGFNPKNSEKINVISGMACKLDFVLF